MFAMTLSATADVRVKRGGLSLQNGIVVRVTNDTVDGFHTLHRRVTGVAIVVEKRVCLRELPRVRHTLPLNGTVQSVRSFITMSRRKINPRRQRGKHHASNEYGPSDFHADHLNPK